jgi:predicted negative regulator of RcsB-dependent stress response
MDEEISIIDNNTRNEKIKNFFLNNKKNLIIGIIVITIGLIAYFSFSDIKARSKIKLADKFNLVKINFKENEKQKTINTLVKIINQNDRTYSPLALYFLLDNNLIVDNNKINKLFDQLITQTNLDEEIKNLIIYKKALFNSDFTNENDLLKILNPIINSESIWKSHALYLLAEFFYSKDEKQKAKEFFNQILILPNSNIDIRTESQKRLNRDLGE